MADELNTNANDITGASGEEKQTPETLLNDKAGETKPLEGDKPESDKPAGAPEEYADFTFADGVEVDNAMLDAAKAEFKAAGYSQEQAQKAIDLHIKNMQAQQEAFMSTRREWVEQIKADKEFGGEHFDTTVSGAQLALRKFDADGEMGKLLEHSGFGDNPTVVKFLARVNKALGEDTVHTSRSQGKGKEEPLEHRLYGKDGMGPKPA